jgi:hypothetical protein
MVAIPRHDEKVSVLRCRDRLSFGSTPAAFTGGGATEPSFSDREELCFCCDGRGLDGIPRVGPTTASPEQARIGSVQALGHRWIDHVEEHDLSIWRGDFGNGIDTRRPGAVSEPRNELHDAPEIRRTAQSAATPATREAGTVNNPRRVNSPMAGRTSWAWRTRRHKRVASDPT